MKTALVVLLCVVVAVSAMPMRKKGGKGGKGGKGDKGPKLPGGLKQLTRFCEGLVDGEIVNTNATLDEVFAQMNTSCIAFLDATEPDDVRLQKIVANIVKNIKKLSNFTL